jgi:hypothetical protein
MRRILACLGLSLVLSVTILAPTSAIDHSNLDEDRPLRVEDPYPIATGELAIEAGGGLRVPRRGDTQGLFPIELLYGAVPNLQLSLGTTIFTDPQTVDEPTKSGDLRVSALYNINQETLRLPAFGIRVTANFPTGTNSAGIDIRVKGLITKSWRRLSVHFNAAHEFLSGTQPSERRGRHQFVLGASVPVGAPKYTRTTVLGDVFAEQSVRHGSSEIVGTEFGVRHQFTPWTVLDAGVGTEFAGPADRSNFFATIGVSTGF